MKLFNKKSILAIILSLLFAMLIYFIGYETPRDNFSQFIFLFLASFALFYGLWLNKQGWNFNSFLILAIGARLILLFAAPELSNDFYRFIWDGELIAKGVNPYAHIPNDLISQAPFYNDDYMRALYHGMGELSQGNYSCYPVLNQLLFYVPASISDSIASNVISLKLMLILADIGVILVGKKILESLGKSSHLIWLYALNPFIILEFSGNLHFEGVMIFFLLASIYLLMKDKWLMAAIFFGLAIQIKLIPLLLIPFLFKKMKWRKSLGFTAMTGVIVLGLAALMMNEYFFENFMTSINLYFNQFEFNASIFYLVREYSFANTGWDEIAIYGPMLSKIAIVSIGLLAVLRSHKKDDSIFTGMLFALVIYYAFATTVHPWYISMILIFSVFTKYKFGLIWSLLVMLSYFAYSDLFFQENLRFVAIEYILVFGIMIIEIAKHTKRSDFGIQFKSFFSD